MDKDSIVNQIIKLREKGMGYRAIATETGISRDMVRYYCKQMGMNGRVKKPRAEDGVTCPQCGGRIEQPSGRGRKRRFCSLECRRKFWHSHPEELNKSDSAIYHLTCLCCHKEFTTYGNKSRKYCSRECFLRYRYWEN